MRRREKAFPCGEASERADLGWGEGECEGEGEGEGGGEGEGEGNEFSDGQPRGSSQGEGEGEEDKQEHANSRGTSSVTRRKRFSCWICDRHFYTHKRFFKHLAAAYGWFGKAYRDHVKYLWNTEMTPELCPPLDHPLYRDTVNFVQRMQFEDGVRRQDGWRARIGDSDPFLEGGAEEQARYEFGIRWFASDVDEALDWCHSPPPFSNADMDECMRWERVRRGIAAASLGQGRTGGQPRTRSGRGDTHHIENSANTELDHSPDYDPGYGINDDSHVLPKHQVKRHTHGPFILKAEYQTLLLPLHHECIPSFSFSGFLRMKLISSESVFEHRDSTSSPAYQDAVQPDYNPDDNHPLILHHPLSFNHLQGPTNNAVNDLQDTNHPSVFLQIKCGLWAAQKFTPVHDVDETGVESESTDKIHSHPSPPLPNCTRLTFPLSKPAQIDADANPNTRSHNLFLTQSLPLALQKMGDVECFPEDWNSFLSWSILRLPILKAIVVHASNFLTAALFIMRCVYLNPAPNPNPEP